VAEPNDATPFLPNTRSLAALRRRRRNAAAPDDESRRAEREAFNADLRLVAEALG
jgi:hypothetical protein